VPDPQAPPAHVERLIVHQFDPARSSPGGIDTCLRGMTRYLPEGMEVAVVGVDTGVGHPGRELGRWERHDMGDGRPFWFLPVTALDPAEGARRVPHSVRLMAGLARYRSRLPRPRIVQVHGLNSALALRLLVRRPQAYFIHTQEQGLTGATSDSFWRFTGDAHGALERRTVGAAGDVVVFNADYAETVRTWNPRARFSPTWFDPGLITNLPDDERDPHQVLWVGRMEVPKDPALAVSAFAALVESDPSAPWRLELLGQGSHLEQVRAQVAALPAATAERIAVPGRVAPPEVARQMGTAGVFLMTSHPGYEGYPRVLVEAMASGLPSVVTDGSDTGGLVVDGKTGFVTGRDAAEIAGRVREAAHLERATVRDAVADLSAPVLIERIYSVPAA
jgi:glycosyltransferase involved in cell wall biosynthesis